MYTYIYTYYFYLKIIHNNLYINMIVFTLWIILNLYTTSPIIMNVNDSYTPYYNEILDNYLNYGGYNPYNTNLISTSMGYRAELSSTPIGGYSALPDSGSIYRFGEIDSNSSYSAPLGEYEPIQGPSYYIRQPIYPDVGFYDRHPEFNMRGSTSYHEPTSTKTAHDRSTWSSIEATVVSPVDPKKITVDLPKKGKFKKFAEKVYQTTRDIDNVTIKKSKDRQRLAELAYYAREDRNNLNYTWRACRRAAAVAANKR